jgi:predicted deacetylase
MKLLMIFSDKFEYNPTIKTIEAAETITEGKSYEKCITAFIHAEESDEEDLNKIEKKMVKNIKWACTKNNTKKVVLHSFAHLSDSKASPEFTKELFDKAEERLKNAEYEVFQTPFGYFLDLNMNAPGFSLARIFKSI